ncbi:hypothetical protein [Ensifer soli]|uniref:hypothetical protein n=1 Tax=Ciceribacter sp. sgz301302 TaxID=3342379 RepID=UPI0035B7E414
MPVRRAHRWLYPIDWPELSRMVRFGRAKGRCEQCARPHGALVCHLGDGRWFDDADGIWRDGRGRALKRQEGPPSEGHRTTRVYLATAHLDHDPGHNRLSNLKALCQRCHMLNDRPEHLRRRRLKHLMGRALGDLFDGVYREP